MVGSNLSLGLAWLLADPPGPESGKSQEASAQFPSLSQSPPVPYAPFLPSQVVKGQRSKRSVLAPENLREERELRDQTDHYPGKTGPAALPFPKRGPRPPNPSSLGKVSPVREWGGGGIPRE